MKLLSKTLAAFVSLVLSADAASDDVEWAVVQFPEIEAWQFRPDVAAECANALITAGKDSTCAQLKRLAEKKWASQKEGETINRHIRLLCQLVFMPHNHSEPLPETRIGIPMLVPNMKVEAWPYLPFAIVNQVPVSVSLGYDFVGVRYPAGEDVLLYASNAVFRTTPFPIPTPASVSNALSQVFSSTAWKALKWKDSGPSFFYDLDEHSVMEQFWEQAKNMPNQHLQPTPR